MPNQEPRNSNHSVQKNYVCVTLKNPVKTSTNKLLTQKATSLSSFPPSLSLLLPLLILKSLNMSMPRHRSLQTIFLVFFVVVVVLPFSDSVAASYSSIHELLRSHGLPAGLFPESVKSYNLDQRGRLEVNLDGPCMTKYETRVLFETVVRANLSFGQLKGLEGLSQEELFLWLPVKDIIVNDPSSGLILIDIGLAHKQLSLSLFEDPRVCRSQGLSLNIGGRKSIGFQDQR